MKIYDKKLAYPYFVWMTLFTVVPLLIVVYYAFTDGNGAFRERYWSRFGERAPVLNALGQSTYEGVAFLRGLLDHRQRDNGSVAFESVRATRWRSNADKAMPIYLAQADGMRFRVIQTLEGSG